MKIIGLTLIVAISCTFVRAQSATVFFETAEHTLSGEATVMLDQFQKRALKAPSARLQIIGHTDQVGNDTYNDNLSKMRSEAVVEYLREHGVSNQFSIDWKGETQLANKGTTDEALAKSRRVTIQLEKLDEAESVPFQVYTKEAEVKSVPTTEETRLTFKGGTIVTIRPQDFNLIDTDSPLEISVQEYYGKSEFVRANLTTTTTDGKLLESKGMIHIEAQQNGQKVELKRGKNIPIDFPDRTENDGTILFTGLTHENAITWKSQNTQVSSLGFIGKSYMFDENNDTILLSKTRAISINGKAFEVEEVYKKGILDHIDTTSMENYHAAMKAINESTTLGWINCDKFNDSDAEKVDFVVSVPERDEAHVMMVFKDLNSVISYSDKIRDQYIFRGVPKGMKVELIAMISEKDVIDFERQSASIDKTTLTLSQLKEIPKDDLNAALSDL